MPLPLPIVCALGTADARSAWAAIFERAWQICSAPLPSSGVAGEVTRRDREVGALDLFLATAGWDLWRDYEGNVERTADALASWWSERAGGRAVLLLDGLSLREVPWIVHGAGERGFEVHGMRVTGAELPAETTPFANALGFSARGALENNGASGGHRLAGARTETVNLPWTDTAKLIQAEPSWVLWHHWPDHRVHDLANAGQGLEKLANEAQRELSGDAFWSLVARLAVGRRLVITSDHGYAASGFFVDTPDDQAKHLKDVFKSGRSAPAAGDAVGAWVPPVDITVTSAHGPRRYAVGRRKWKSQGGYPTLTHGGLSVLEVASPFIELSRKA
jgi:hypothetical protein